MLKQTPSFESANATAPHAASAEKRPQFTQLLVPFDFSQNATALVEKVIPWAAATGASVHLIYVVDPTEVFEDAPPSGTDSTRESVSTASKKLLAAWARKMLRARVETHFAVHMGDPADRIIDYANAISADLIVMSTCGYGRLKDVFSRSITEQVSSRASCPVLAWPESSIRRAIGPDPGHLFLGARRILVPIDFSDASRKALGEASRLAERNHAELLLLTVVEEIGEVTNVEETMLRQKVERWAHEQLPITVPLRSSVWIGMSSLYAILLEAKRSQADLIVLPSRRRSCVNRFHMAHLADSILRHAPCPVLSTPFNQTDLDEGR